jgi:LmbE family N-acetylglucosaminyl deacetylase
MRFHLSTAEIFIPDALSVADALKRTTHMAVAAHQDDIEIMAASPIIACFQQPDLWFTGVVVTDGRGSPRDDIYKNYTDEEMRQVRFKEQKKAAVVGEFSAQVLLDYPSRMVKDGAETKPVEDLAALFLAARPKIVYTHNLADKHDTHVAVALKTIAALRRLPLEARPEKVYGCEVWRGLDWMIDADKVALDMSTHESLQAALLGVFDSQIAGGKRYDLATMGRRKANATYFESHSVDASTGVSWAMDLTPLIAQADSDVAAFVDGAIQRFAQEVVNRLKRVG